MRVGLAPAREKAKKEKAAGEATAAAAAATATAAVVAEQAAVENSQNGDQVEDHQDLSGSTAAEELVEINHEAAEEHEEQSHQDQLPDEDVATEAPAPEHVEATGVERQEESNDATDDTHVDETEQPALDAAEQVHEADPVVEPGVAEPQEEAEQLAKEVMPNQIARVNEDIDAGDVVATVDESEPPASADEGPAPEEHVASEHEPEVEDVREPAAPAAEISHHEPDEPVSSDHEDVPANTKAPIGTGTDIEDIVSMLETKPVAAAIVLHDAPEIPDIDDD